jgi:hypothetical protein
MDQSVNAPQLKHHPYTNEIALKKYKNTLKEFTSCYGLLFGSPFTGGYVASAQPVTWLHWTPAT